MKLENYYFQFLDPFISASWIQIPFKKRFRIWIWLAKIQNKKQEHRILKKILHLKGLKDRYIGYLLSFSPREREGDLDAGGVTFTGELEGGLNKTKCYF